RLIESILHEEPVSLAQLSEKVPAELVAVVTKALNKDREQRYQSADDLLIDLKALQIVQERRVEQSRTTELVEPVSTVEQRKFALTSKDGWERTSASTVKRIAGAISRRKVLATTTLLLITLASISGYVWYERHRKAAASISSNTSRYVFTGKWRTK